MVTEEALDVIFDKAKYEVWQRGSVVIVSEELDRQDRGSEGVVAHERQSSLLKRNFHAGGGEMVRLEAYDLGDSLCFILSGIASVASRRRGCNVGQISTMHDTNATLQVTRDWATGLRRARTGKVPCCPPSQLRC